MSEPFLLVLGPGDRPLHTAAFRKVDLPDKRPGRQHRVAVEARREEIAEPAGEMKLRLGWDALRTRHGRVAAPANFEAAEQVCLGPRHAVERRRPEAELAENFRVGMEAHRRAAPVVHRPAVPQARLRYSPAIALAPQLAVARDLDLELVRERVDDRDPDAVQTARSPIGLAAEFAARMEGRQDHFERRSVREPRMRIDRDAAAVITDSNPVTGAELDLDAGGMAGDRLVHRIVEDFGHEMMEPALVGTADIHAGAAANRLQPLQDLDVFGGIAVTGFRRRRVEEIGHGTNIRRAGVPASRMKYGVASLTTRCWTEL